MTLRQHPNLDSSDHLLAEIAIVDPTCAIICTNRKWEETAGIGRLAQTEPYWNYIAECEAASRRGCGDAVKILAGLREVLNGHLASFIANYARTSGRARRPADHLMKESLVTRLEGAAIGMEM
jgi:hypothetical protein